MRDQILLRIRSFGRFVITMALIAGLLAPSFVPVAMAQAKEVDAKLSGEFSFTSAPLVGEPAELVLAVSAIALAQVSTEITLPDEIALVAGRLEGQGRVEADASWKQAVIVKVLVEGEFKITAQIEGVLADGSPVSAPAHIYVASSTERASASELEVAIPKDMVVTPPDGTAGASVDVEQEGEQATESGDIAEFGAPNVQAQEGDAEAELGMDAEQGLVTLGDETPTQPRLGDAIEYSFDKVDLEEEAATGQVVLDDDSSAEPGVASGVGYRQDSEMMAEAKYRVYLPSVLGSGAASGSNEAPDREPHMPGAAGDVAVEGEIADDVQQVLSEPESGFVTIGEDSPAEPQVVAEPDDGREVYARQDMGTSTSPTDAQTELTEPRGEPWAVPQEIKVPAPDMEARDKDKELVLGGELLKGHVTQGDGSSAEPKMLVEPRDDREIVAEPVSGALALVDSARTALVESPDAPWAVPQETEVAGVEAEGEGQPLALSRDTQAGQITRGDASSAEPEVMVDPDDGRAVVAQQDGAEISSVEGAQAELVEPPGAPWGKPQEVEANVTDIETKSGGQELTIDVQALEVREDSSALIESPNAPWAEPRIVEAKVPPVQVESPEGESALNQDTSVGWSTVGDGSPTVPRVVRDQVVESEVVDEALVIGFGRDLVNVGDDSPAAPKDVAARDVLPQNEPPADGWKLEMGEGADVLASPNSSSGPPTFVGSGERDEDVSPNAGVDLIVEDIWFTTNPLKAGDSENITFRIKNQGTSSTSTTFHIKMQVDGTTVGSWYANGACAGCTGTASTSVKVSSAGNHAVRVEVDNTKVVPETNEGNNIRTETWYWAPSGGVDLIVEDIWSTTNPLTAGVYENITFRIKNQGTASTSTKFYAKMWIDSTTIQTWYTNGLAAGSTATGAVNVKVSSPGNHVVKVEVDNTKVVPESNEGNNIRTETWTWVPGSAVDLIVQDIWLTTSPLTAGQWENATFRIKNQGTASTSTKFYAKMWIDSTTIQTWYTNGLAAGSTATGAVNVKVSSPGNHAVKVEVDNTKVVPESNEGNNIRTETWTWVPGSAVDLIVQDIWFDDESTHGGAVGERHFPDQEPGHGVYIDQVLHQDAGGWHHGRVVVCQQHVRRLHGDWLDQRQGEQPRQTHGQGRGGQYQGGAREQRGQQHPHRDVDLGAARHSGGPDRAGHLVDDESAHGGAVGERHFPHQEPGHGVYIDQVLHQDAGGRRHGRVVVCQQHVRRLHGDWLDQRQGEQPRLPHSQGRGGQHQDRAREQ